MQLPQLAALRTMDKHGTNDPFKIIKERNGIYLFEDLLDIWGYYHKFSRVSMIHINNRLDEFNTLYTGSHELGHDILHPGINTPFLRQATLFSVNRIEREANCFALYLRLGDNKPMRDETSSHFLCRCNIPSKFHCFY